MKQEPVAWVTTLKKPKDGFITAYAVNDYPFNIPLYAAPTIVKDEQGKVVAVTLTNEEHQVQEVLWEAPRELSDEEIRQLDWNTTDMIAFARAILKKASENV